MLLVMTGAVVMGFAVVGLFFLRFWRNTRDRLFLFFAFSFFILAVNRIGLLLVAEPSSRRDALYWVRLVAFLLILAGIADKNRSRKRSATPAKDNNPNQAG